MSELSPEAGTEQVATDTQENDGNPKWKPILDAIPDELHHLIKPQLAEWDKGINQKFQEIHQKYDPYKQYMENNVAPDMIEQGLYLIQELNNNPADIVKQAIDAFGLDFVEKAAMEAQAQQQTNNNDEFWQDEDGNIDITKHPQFKALAEKVNQFSEFQTKNTEKEQQEKAAEDFGNYLTQLEKDNGEFDKMYVTALISQGIDGVQAVKQYHDTVNQAAAKLAGGQQQNQQQAPPVVMGGDGTTGSGLATTPVNFSSMKNNELNDLVAQIIAKQDTDNT